MKVLLDTCVIYPTVMREMILGVAAGGAFEPLWSERILAEWARAARHALAEEGVWRADPDGFLHGIWQAQPALVAKVAEEVLEKARALSTGDWELRALLKKAKLPRLAKALAA